MSQGPPPPKKAHDRSLPTVVVIALWFLQRVVVVVGRALLGLAAVVVLPVLAIWFVLHGASGDSLRELASKVTTSADAGARAWDKPEDVFAAATKALDPSAKTPAAPSASTATSPLAPGPSSSTRPAPRPPRRGPTPL